MAKMTLDELQAQLSGLGEYQKKTDDELKAQAESLYKAQYEQNLRLLQDSIRQGVAQQQRSTLDTGMQRSSYNQAQQALIRGRGLEAQTQLGTDYSTNVATLLLNLMNTEYERENAAKRYRDQLLMSLYEYGNNSSGGGSAPKTQSVVTATTPTVNTDPFSLIENALLSASSGASIQNSGVNQISIGNPTNKVTQVTKSSGGSTAPKTESAVTTTTPNVQPTITVNPDPFSLIENALLSASSGASIQNSSASVRNSGVNQISTGNLKNKLTQALK